MKRIACGMGAAAIVSVVACGGASAGAEPPPAAKQAAAEMCAKACAVAEKCNGKADADVCRAKCVADPKLRHVDALRPEMVENIGACFGALSCDDATKPRDVVVKRCIAEATRNVAPPAKVTAMCSRFDALTDRCGGPMAGCADKFKVLNDSILDQYTACASETSCKVAGRCIKEVTASYTD